MAATNRIDCRSPINGGGRLWAEGLLSGARRCSAAAEFIMVAVDETGRAQAF